MRDWSNVPVGVKPVDVVEDHYMGALQKVGVELKTHDIYVVHLLGESTPPFMTRNKDAVKALVEEYGDAMVIYMNPVHEVDNVVYIGDSLKMYTNTFTPVCTVTNERRV
jgi:hypothetical protein